jgi:hypothetical protein
MRYLPDGGSLSQGSTRPGVSLPTKKSQWFDIIGGLVLPAVCVVADPIVFKTSFVLGNFRGPLLQRYAVAGYLEILIGMVALTIFLWRRPASPFLAGILLAGAMFAFVLGAVLLPFSLLGLFFVIGALGFTPFFSGFVFARACLHTIRTSLTIKRTSRIALYVSLGVLCALAIPVGLQFTANRKLDAAVHRLLTGDQRAHDQRLLRLMNWAADLEPVLSAYMAEKDETRKQHLATVYEDITGTDIEERLRALAD